MASPLTAQALETNPHTHFLLLTHPRSASNLLVRILLSAQPRLEPRDQGGYFFLSPYFNLRRPLNIDDKPIGTWSSADKDRMKAVYRTSFTELQQHLANADRNGRITVVKEHSCMLAAPEMLSGHVHGAQSLAGLGHEEWIVDPSASDAGEKADALPPNPTVLPNTFLSSTLPVILIRHPALSFPSYYRTSRQEDVALGCSLRFSRQVYEWCSTHMPSSYGGVSWPIVIDADDVMSDPGVMARLCGILGLETEKMRYQWGTMSKEELDALPSDAIKRYLATLAASEGVLEGKLAGKQMDVDAEVGRWRQEFGEREGRLVEGWVRDAMEDWEFLREKKLRATG